MILVGPILSICVDGGEFRMKIRKQVQVEKERHKTADLRFSAFLVRVKTAGDLEFIISYPTNLKWI